MTALCITPDRALLWLLFITLVPLVGAVIVGTVMGVIDGIRKDRAEYANYLKENPR